MVRTRQKTGESAQADTHSASLYNVLNASTSRKTTNQADNNAAAAQDSDEYDCSLSTRKRRRKCNSSNNDCTGISKPDFSDMCTSKSLPMLHRPVTRLAYRRFAQLSEDVENCLVSKDDKTDRSVCHHYNNHSYMNGDSDLHNTVRRSTRRRKFIYDNLNQRWLLTSSIHDFSKFDFMSDNKTPERNESDTLGKSSDKPNGELRRLGLANSELQFEDMYSRVKRERRKAVREYYSQQTCHETGNMADTEETDHNESTDDDQVTETGTVGSGDESHEDGSSHPKYSLRPKKPVTERFQFPIEQFKPKRVNSIFHASNSSHHQRQEHHTFKSPAHRSPLFKRKRRHAIHSSSATSSSSDDERRFERRKAKSMAKARNRCLPMNLSQEELATGVFRDRVRIGSSLADVDPMSLDKSVMFEHIGGLDHHINALKEMVLFPLMYPEVFEKFKIAPPRGVLFHGPPGTGKTLIARALANECSQGDRKVAFFMRKGADCLSKWVGESERQLRLLFDQAHSMRPSIIFFDEIDGLAPVRSTRQDQIHSSIVSTLLALMDGLDSRGEIVVIGATNRIDAIDAALRRPGRFDREFLFSLPSLEARHSILKIHTRMWQPPLNPHLLQDLAVKSVGYCGADLKALCSEAALIALRRRYPQIYTSQRKLLLDVNSIRIEASDFGEAMNKIVPASQRSASSPARPLSPVVRPLLEKVLLQTLKLLQTIFPAGIKKSLSKNRTNLGLLSSISVSSQSACDSDGISSDGDLSDSNRGDSNATTQVGTLGSNTERNLFLNKSRWILSHRPRLLLAGHKDQGQNTHLAPALIHCLESVSLHKLDLPTLYAVTTKAPEEACAQVFYEARRSLPSIIYVPHIGHWWSTLNDTVRATFLTLLDDIEPPAPLLLLATSDRPYSELPQEVQDLFDTYHGEVVEMKNPSKEERLNFFSDLFLRDAMRLQMMKKKKAEEMEKLPLAPSPEPRQLSEQELMRLRQQEESTLRELRLFLREILNKLARDRRFSMFAKPVDPEEVPDYLEVIKNPLDLETMMTKIDLHQYETAQQFLNDIDLICQNALEYNPDRDPTDKLIRHRACALKDTAHALIDTELDEEFEKICEDIHKARQERGELTATFYSHVVPKNHQMSRQEESKSDAGKVDQPYPTRFSRRLRGMGTTPPSSENENSRKSQGSNTGPTYSQRRRQRGWSIRRYQNHLKQFSKEKAERTDSPDQSEMFETRSANHCHSNEQTRTSRSPSRSQDINQSDHHARTSFELTLTDDSEISVDNMNCHSQKMSITSTANFNNQHCLHPDSVNRCHKDGKCSVTIAQSSSNLDEQNHPSSTDESHEIAKITAGTPESQSQDSELHLPESTVENDIGQCEENQVIFDVEKAQSLLELTVTVTEDCSVGILERLFCSLQRCVHKHRREWDKSKLLMDLQEEIEKFRRHWST